jgi:hypothetical protein
VPDLGALLPSLGVGGTFLDSYAASLTSTLRDGADGLVASSIENLEGMLDDASSEADAEAFEWVQNWVRKAETGSDGGEGDKWEPAASAVGLQKVTHKDGSLWVSEACAEEYRARGRAALPV